MFMRKISADTLCIFDKSLFFLYEEIGILGHAFIDFLLRVSIFFVMLWLPYEVRVLEVLIDFFEVEELALNVECSHLML